MLTKTKLSLKEKELYTTYETPVTRVELPSSIQHSTSSIFNPLTNKTNNLAYSADEIKYNNDASCSDKVSLFAQSFEPNKATTKVSSLSSNEVENVVSVVEWCCQTAKDYGNDI